MNPQEMKKANRVQIIITLGFSDDLTFNEEAFIDEEIVKLLRECLNNLPMRGRRIFNQPILEIVPLPHEKQIQESIN